MTAGRTPRARRAAPPAPATTRRTTGCSCRVRTIRRESPPADRWISDSSAWSPMISSCPTTGGMSLPWSLQPPSMSPMFRRSSWKKGLRLSRRPPVRSRAAQQLELSRNLVVTIRRIDRWRTTTRRLTTPCRDHQDCSRQVTAAVPPQISQIMSPPTCFWSRRIMPTISVSVSPSQASPLV